MDFRKAFDVTVLLISDNLVKISSKHRISFHRKNIISLFMYCQDNYQMIRSIQISFHSNLFFTIISYLISCLYEMLKEFISFCSHKLYRRHGYCTTWLDGTRFLRLNSIRNLITDPFFLYRRFYRSILYGASATKFRKR